MRNPMIPLVFAFGATASFAAPTISSVTGLVSDGEDVTISGAEFGSNSLGYEFLGGSNGHIETAPNGRDSSFGRWTIASGSTQDQSAFVVSDSNVRSGSKAWLLDMSTSSYYNGSVRYDLGRTIPTATTVYASWWVKKDAVDNDGQWKMFRLTHENDIVDNGTELTMFNWLQSSPQMIVRPGTTATGSSPISYYGRNYPAGNNQWYRMELIMRTSNQGVQDGTVAQYLHYPAGGRPVTLGSWSNSQSSSSYRMNYDSSLRYRWFIWQNYRGNGITSMKVWMDDFFIQVGSQARVEIGDASTWANCTFREVQPATSWTSSGVRIRLNKGGLREGTQYYAYVVDSTGAVSNGFPIQIGADGAARPMAPVLTISQ